MQKTYRIKYQDCVDTDNAGNCVVLDTKIIIQNYYYRSYCYFFPSKIHYINLINEYCVWKQVLWECFYLMQYT